ncbi:replicase polyprotein 1a [Elysia marginata]|uniref:Replicase polyprotein 1a n=1 Tax=Elysia marginata TaxID=1093978 RepID=A0AAV4GZR9_9GAST|nr:replicase polyprotein 1a [Elysia marginata]
MSSAEQSLTRSAVVQTSGHYNHGGTGHSEWPRPTSGRLEDEIYGAIKLSIETSEKVSVYKNDKIDTSNDEGDDDDDDDDDEGNSDDDHDGDDDNDNDDDEEDDDDNDDDNDDEGENDEGDNDDDNDDHDGDDEDNDDKKCYTQHRHTNFIIKILLTKKVLWILKLTEPCRRQENGGASLPSYSHIETTENKTQKHNRFLRREYIPARSVAPHLDQAHSRRFNYADEIQGSLGGKRDVIINVNGALRGGHVEALT